MNVDQMAALIRVAVSHETLRHLYHLGVVRPDREAEDLASALSRLTSAAVSHGLSLGR
jgi:hypothetical protein